MTQPLFADHRQHIQAMLAAALAAANPYTAVSQQISRSGNRVKIGQHSHSLANGRLFLISIGKAAVPMAQAALDCLGKAVIFGGIITKHQPANVTLPLPIYEGDHPVPGKKSVAATTAVLNTITQATANDLILCLISGGASALFSQPHLPLDSWQQLNQALLASGCTIQELNSVRRQLDAVKAGGLARLAAPAKLISLILSDVVGNELAAIGSGPTVGTNETPADALAILERYHVEEWLETAASTGSGQAAIQTIQTTLKQLPNTNPPTNIIDNIIVGSNRQSAEAAGAVAQTLGFQTSLLTTQLEGESREVGKFVAAIAKDAPKNSAIILGGETTVTLRGNGKGGRNCETALSAAISLAGWHNRVIISFATDGDDGTSGTAGAIITGNTVQNQHIAQQHLDNNDSFTYFATLDAATNATHLIQTGPTGTNVNDLLIILNYVKRGAESEK
jgi:hydroxypyruvate reductase